MTRARWLGTVSALISGLTTAPAWAQGNFEIQVYGSELTTPGQTTVELHTNTAIKGTTRTEDGVVRTQGAVHETLEITYGFTEWFETAFYLFTSIQPDSGWQWVGDHIRPRARIPESWHWPVGVSLSTELGYQRREFSTDTWTWEIRPIVDQKIGRWYWAFNPAVETSLKGDNAGKGFAFTPAAKVSYDVTSRVAAGLEYYGDLGQIAHIDPPRSRAALGVQPRGRRRAHARHRSAHRQDDSRLPVRPAAHAGADPVAASPGAHRVARGAPC